MQGRNRTMGPFRSNSDFVGSTPRQEQQKHQQEEPTGAHAWPGRLELLGSAHADTAGRPLRGFMEVSASASKNRWSRLRRSPRDGTNRIAGAVCVGIEEPALPTRSPPCLRAPPTTRASRGTTTRAAPTRATRALPPRLSGRAARRRSGRSRSRPARALHPGDRRRVFLACSPVLDRNAS
jgi:hypothetical protein